MGKDPRFKNQRLDHSSIESTLKSYTEMYVHGMSSVNREQLVEAINAVKQASEKGAKIFVAGNGGSAAIANHLTCDFTKGTYHSGHPPLVTESLVANPSNLMAIANDFSFEESISLQVKMLAKPADLLILISSSGNSPNIVKACEQAKAMGIKVIGFSGFSGGGLKDSSDISLYVEVSNYAVVEDCHQSLMQIIAQQIAYERDQ